MKRPSPFFRRTALAGLALLVLSPLQAQAPAWWGNQGVLVSGAAPNDFAPANQGQLKNMAKAAMNEMGLSQASAVIHNVVDPWTQNATQAQDFSVATLGQVKAVAQPFYDQLGLAYPWTSTTADDSDYAIATVGQLKRVFSFGLSGYQTDTDGDGLSDPYETYLGSNANDYFSQGANTIVPRIFVYGGGGAWVASGQYSDGPIIYKVVNKATGAALANAPVTIAVTAGPGKVSTATGGAATTTVTVRTDAQGLAKAFFKAP